MMLRQRYRLPNTTTGTDLAGRFPAVYLYNLRAGLGSDLLQDGHKFGKADVAHLPAPRPLHALEVQRLQTNEFEPSAKLVSPFPMGIPALVGNSGMDLGQSSPGYVPIFGPLLLFGLTSFLSGQSHSVRP